MANYICNTSPLQYLHQLGLLHLLPALKANGVDLPDLAALEWIEIRQPLTAKISNLVTDLGAGETEVLALAFEFENPVVILDDALARQTAERLHLKITGTLGVLVSAKNKGLIDKIEPVLDRLDFLRFRLSAMTRRAVLDLTGE